MKHKRLKLCSVLLLVFGLSGLQAQTMYVKETGGSIDSYALSSIKRLTFSSGNMKIIPMGGSTPTYVLANLRYVSFKNPAGIFETDQKLSGLISFPNPVNDVLNIDLAGAKDLNGTISILSLDGKLLYTRQITEAGIVSLDVSLLPNGVYICNYSNKTEIKSVKIIKQ